jgi:hypothetical protein
MTRDVSVDLPAAPFRLVLGGLRGRRVTVSAYDPLTGKHTPARVVRRAADRVTIELDLTDSPRLLHISDAHAPTPPRAAPR